MKITEEKLKEYLEFGNLIETRIDEYLKIQDYQGYYDKLIDIDIENAHIITKYCSYREEDYYNETKIPVSILTMSEEEFSIWKKEEVELKRKKEEEKKLLKLKNEEKDRQDQIRYLEDQLYFLKNIKRIK